MALVDRASMTCRVGEPIVFEGYADDFAHGISAVQFSLDDGVSWTSYPTEGAVPDKGMNWTFSYKPTAPGRYLMRARAVDGEGRPSEVVTRFAFTVVEAGEGATDTGRDVWVSPDVMLPVPCVPTVSPVQTYGPMRLRAVGGGALAGARLFRSAELKDVSPEQSAFITRTLGIRSIYDIRNQWEVAVSAEPCLAGAKSVAFEPSENRRRKDAGSRLVAGVIGEYGAPEERMCKNYRRYARDYPLIGATLRALASELEPALVHCVNGKDRTGVLCAVLLRAAGWHVDDIMEDYLAANTVNADAIRQEFEVLSRGMTGWEEAILRSFLEARPAYLQAFFDEAESAYGTFERYVRDGLRLAPAHVERLTWLAAR